MCVYYNILSIIRGTTVDGPGFRTSIYLAGCCHQCPSCHNPQSWNPHAGKIMTLEEIMKIVEEEDFDVTLSGGDPLYNPDSTKVLIKALKDNGRNVWVYTGYTWEEITSSEILTDAVKKADYLVDGPFIQSRKNPDLLFRGSDNQRIINIKESLQKQQPIFYNQ
ncbi:MAG: anaerobic ribonucleoside-triphosphate reductase activating protein [Muribaculaceae bacterium]